MPTAEFTLSIRRRCHRRQKPLSTGRIGRATRPETAYVHRNASAFSTPRSLKEITTTAETFGGDDRPPFPAGGAERLSWSIAESHTCSSNCHVFDRVLQHQHVLHRVRAW